MPPRSNHRANGSHGRQAHRMPNSPRAGHGHGKRRRCPGGQRARIRRCGRAEPSRARSDPRAPRPRRGIMERRAGMLYRIPRPDAKPRSSVINRCRGEEGRRPTSASPRRLNRALAQMIGAGRWPGGSDRARELTFWGAAGSEIMARPTASSSTPSSRAGSARAACRPSPVRGTRHNPGQAMSRLQERLPGDAAAIANARARQWCADRRRAGDADRRRRAARCRCRRRAWGIVVEVAGLAVRPVECHHWSAGTLLPIETRVVGTPGSTFIVETEPGVRIVPLRRHLHIRHAG